MTLTKIGIGLGKTKGQAGEARLPISRLFACFHDLYANLSDMSRIKVQNFGPIREGLLENDGWLEVNKVTVFVGDQGTGKSTVAKLISTFSWMEKALVRGDFDPKWLVWKNRSRSRYLEFHRLESYLIESGSNKTLIEFNGDAYNFRYSPDGLVVTASKVENYLLPQILYVPAERNFIACVRSPKELRLSSGSMQDFISAYERAKADLRIPLPLPTEGVNLEYDQLNDLLSLRGADYKVKLSDASSGFQSLVPLYLVSSQLAHQVLGQIKAGQEPMSSEERERFRKNAVAILTNDDLSPEQKDLALSALSARFNKTAFVNIVEEPEQNLFPASQRQLLHSLLELNNLCPGNKLILTTHSPYIIGFLNIAIHGHDLAERARAANKQGWEEPLGRIVPVDAIVPNAGVAVYEMEPAGRIHRLPSPEGILSGNNYLNAQLREGNRLFDALLELEETLGL
jgi:predicted ATPase